MGACCSLGNSRSDEDFKARGDPLLHSSHPQGGGVRAGIRAPSEPRSQPAPVASRPLPLLVSLPGTPSGLLTCSSLSFPDPITLLTPGYDSFASLTGA